MNFGKRGILIICCTVLLVAACADGFNTDYKTLYPTCSITVSNESDFAIMEIYLVEFSSPEWSENLLSTLLQTGQSISFAKAKGVYKMLVVQEGDVIAEVPSIDVVDLEVCKIVVE